MTEVIDLLKLFGGFVYLLMGGDLLVRGALGLARESRVPPMVVGLTIVAMGTSAPELMVSSFSALSGYPELAIGNVVGSNIANVLLVIGVPVLIQPIVCNQDNLIKQTSLMIMVSVLLLVLCLIGTIGFWSGVLLVFILACFLVATTRGMSVMPGVGEADEELERALGMPGTTTNISLFIVLGVIGLPLGADLVVEGAVGLAASWGVSEAVIGLSVIAVATSLPELSTTVMAAFHRSSDVAIGNVVGSNLFNILAILGITSMLVPIRVDPSFFRYDLWIMLGSAVLLWMFVLARGTIGRLWGVAFLAAYAGYLVSIF